MSEQRPTDSESASIEERCVFALMQNADPAGALTIAIGIPRAAYERLANGKTLHFHTKVMPLQIVLFGGADHAACMKTLQDSAASLGVTIDDQRRKDWGIKT